MNSKDFRRVFPFREYLNSFIDLKDCTPAENFCTPAESFCTPAENFCTPAENFCTPAENIFRRFKRSAHVQKVFSTVLKDLHTCRKDFLSF
jgi:hypothetical protein